MRGLILGILSVAVFAVSASAAIVVPLENLNTGISGGIPITDASADPNWSINGGTAFVTNRFAGSNVAGCTQAFPFCGAADSGGNQNYWDNTNYTTSRWLSPSSGYGPDGQYVDGNAPGTYDFTRTFQLDDVATIIAASVNFQLEVDNRVTGVFLNGHDTGISLLPGADAAAIFRNFSTTFSITNASWFVNGVNTLTFRVINDVSPWQQWNVAPYYWNATGLRVQFDASTITYDSVPEPSTFVLCGLGAVALMIGKRRR